MEDLIYNYIITLKYFTTAYLKSLVCFINNFITIHSTNYP